jgi:hypothetical protein
MAWKKNSPDAIHRFDALVAVEGAKRGVLFGCPIYVLEGERYATLYQNQIVLRLSPADAADLISKEVAHSSRSRGGGRKTASFCRTKSLPIDACFSGG